MPSKGYIFHANKISWNEWQLLAALLFRLHGSYKICHLKTLMTVYCQHFCICLLFSVPGILSQHFINHRDSTAAEQRYVRAPENGVALQSKTKLKQRGKCLSKDPLYKSAYVICKICYGSLKRYVLSYFFSFTWQAVLILLQHLLILSWAAVIDQA